jgi:uncharacterized repeat protein (TIGR02543 family)
MIGKMIRTKEGTMMKRLSLLILLCSLIIVMSCQQEVSVESNDVVELPAEPPPPQYEEKGVITLSGSDAGSTYTARVYPYESVVLATGADYGAITDSGKLLAVAVAKSEGGSVKLPLLTPDDNVFTESGIFIVVITKVGVEGVGTEKYGSVMFMMGCCAVTWGQMHDAPVEDDEPEKPDYGISLDVPAVYVFPTEREGYGEQIPISVGVINTGKQPTGVLTVSVSTADDGSSSPFLLSTKLLAGIEPLGKTSFIVAVRAGLTAGIYAGVCQVIGGDGITAAFAVNFRVSTLPVYTVTFDTAGGNPPGGTQMVVEGETASAPSALDLFGHTFAGWYTEPNGKGKEWLFNVDVVTKDITLYAKWEAASYIVRFYAEGGGVASPSEVNVVHGGKVTRPEVVNTGYIASGWWTAPVGGEEWDFERGVTSDLRLYVRWTQTHYLVVFETYSRNTAASIHIAGDSLIPRPEDPANVGWGFAGWYTEPNGGGRAWDFNNDRATKSLTLHAKWVAAHTVSFDTSYGDGEPKTFALKVNDGNRSPIPTAPSKTGLTFSGWWEDPVNGARAFDFTAPITRSIALYAKWEAALTYDSKGGLAVAPSIVREGLTVQKPADPTKTGLTFDGWYDPNVKFDFTAPLYYDKTVTARWMAEVTFELRNESEDPTLSKSVVEGGKIDIIIPVRTGYTFVDWYTEENGVSDIWDFDTDTVTKHTTLYAKWEPITFNIRAYTSIFETEETYKGEKIERTVTYGDSNVTAALTEIKNLSLADKDLKRFRGWYQDIFFNTPVVFESYISTSFTSDVTFYSKWVPIYEIKINTRNTGGPAGTDGHIVQTLWIAEGDSIDWDSLDTSVWKFPTVFSAIEGFYVDRGNEKWTFNYQTYTQRITGHKVRRSMELYAKYVVSDFITPSPHSIRYLKDMTGYTACAIGIHCDCQD